MQEATDTLGKHFTTKVVVLYQVSKEIEPKRQVENLALTEVWLF